MHNVSPFKYIHIQLCDIVSRLTLSLTGRLWSASGKAGPGSSCCYAIIDVPQGEARRFGHIVQLSASHPGEARLLRRPICMRPRRSGRATIQFRPRSSRLQPLLHIALRARTSFSSFASQSPPLHETFVPPIRVRPVRSDQDDRFVKTGALPDCPQSRIP